MPKPLSISPIPFRSSALAIPPSPFTSRPPLTPPATPPKHQHSTYALPTSIKSPALPPPPSDPLPWLWQCHICRHTYKLSVTRRCLDDGHRFCAGATVTVSKSGKRRVKTHAPCKSEFDYRGWTQWGDWRRTAIEMYEAYVLDPQSCVSPLFGAEQVSHFDPDSDDEEGSADDSLVTMNESALGGSRRCNEKNLFAKNCWANCDYPSQCRWGKRIDAPLSPPATTAPGFEPVVSTPEPSFRKTKSYKDLGAMSSDVFAPTGDLSISTRKATDTVQETKSVDIAAQDKCGLGQDQPIEELVASLIASADKRRRSSASLVPSPLRSQPTTTTIITTTAQNADMAASGSAGADGASAISSASSSASSYPGSVASQGRHFSKALDDLENELRKSFERANGLLGGVLGTFRSTRPSE